MTTPDPAAGESTDKHSTTAPLEAVAELLRQILSAMPPPEVPGPARPDHSGRSGAAENVERAGQGDIVGFVSQLILFFLSSGLRSWGRAAEILGTAAPLIGETFSIVGVRGTGDPGQQARNLDELRAALRELAELPIHESRRLQAELERIVLRLGPAPAPAAEPEAYWRRWEAKR